MASSSNPNLVKGSLWRALDDKHKEKFVGLSVQWARNKKAASNKIRSKSRGVSLEMLEKVGVLGVDYEDPKINTFMSDLIECQSDVAAYVQTLPPLFVSSQFWLNEFRTASASGKLAPLGYTTDLFKFLENLVAGLNVFAHCPQLAPEHVPPPQRWRGPR
jgi:hypothetical protein